MVAVPVPTPIVGLAGIAALVIRLRPWVVAIAWRIAIMGPVAIAMGATANSQDDEQHAHNSRELFHFGSPCHWFDRASRYST